MYLQLEIFPNFNNIAQTVNYNFGYVYVGEFKFLHIRFFLACTLIKVC